MTAAEGDPAALALDPEEARRLRNERIEAIGFSQTRGPGPGFGQGRNSVWLAGEVAKVLRERFGVECILGEILEAAGPRPEETAHDRSRAEKTREQEGRERASLAPFESEVARERVGSRF